MLNVPQLRHNAVVYCKQYLCWQQLKVTNLEYLGGGMFHQRFFFACNEFNVEKTITCTPCDTSYSMPTDPHDMKVRFQPFACINVCSSLRFSVHGVHFNMGMRPGHISPRDYWSECDKTKPPLYMAMQRRTIVWFCLKWHKKLHTFSLWLRRFFHRGFKKQLKQEFLQAISGI